MAGVIQGGPRTWSGDWDDEGYRTYVIEWLVLANVTDGPANVLRTPGLLLPGAAWLVDADIDLWSWVRAKRSARIHQEKEGDPNRWWKVTQYASNKPPDRDKQRCQDSEIEDPLLEPQKISGGFIKFTEEGTRDRHNNPITNSAHEQIRGPQNEWDAGRQTVRIEQNVPLLQVPLVASMMHHLNDAPLWGLPARCIKLSNFTWERRFHGLCYLYYTRTFEFEVWTREDPDTLETVSGWDRDLLDEGTKALRGDWQRDPTSTFYKQYVVAPDLDITTAYHNPSNFTRFKDWNGENTKTILNGKGRPYDPGTTSTGTGTGEDTTPGEIHVEYYDSANLLLLGIPLTF